MNSFKKGYIYKIELPNGKIYIGQTINPKRRKYYYKNLISFKQHIKLYNSCKKNGWIPFDYFEVIDEIVTDSIKTMLNEKEKYWIKYYNSFNNGLNCNEGGNGNIGHKHSKETKRKLSESAKGRKHSEETKKIIGEASKGRKHSEESKKLMSKIKKERMNNNTKLKISIGLKGNKNGVGNKGRSKKIICLTNNKIYESIKDAANELGLHSDGIIKVCKGEYTQTKGYIFKYYE